MGTVDYEDGSNNPSDKSGLLPTQMVSIMKKQSKTEL